MIREASKDIGDPDVDTLDATVQELRRNFADGTTLDINFRRTALKNVIRGCDEMEAEITKAIYGDLRTDDTYAYMTNIMMLKNEAKDCLSHLNEWTAAKHAETPLTFYPGRSYVKPQPRGVVCILGSWNFPINSLAPFVSAIAAGNAVIIKPSEFSPNCSHVMKKFFETYLDKRYYKCVEGAVKTGIKLTSTAFDMICFTGSTFTGKLIARAASEHLTPLILELGGKCPTIVDRSANIGLAAKRIVSGKFGNCGQVCLAPDYVFVHREMLNPLVTELKNQITAQFGAEPKNNKNYARLVHEVNRL